jgi:predicted nucleotidyltransferase
METEIGALIEKAAAALKAAGAREVYVFGSASKGKLRPGADADMAVSGLPPEVYFRAMAAAHDALGRPLDLVDLDDDNAFTRYLKQEGELQRVGQSAKAGRRRTPAASPLD